MHVADQPARPSVSALHPAIYGMLAGCVVWMMAALWLFFGHDGPTAFMLVVDVFFAAAFLAPLAIIGVSLKSERVQWSSSLRDWLGREFETGQGRVKARDAAIMILIAPAAGAIAITLVSLAAYIAAVNAG